MPDQKISALLALSLLASPITLPASTSSYGNTKTASSIAPDKAPIVLNRPNEIMPGLGAIASLYREGVKNRELAKEAPQIFWPERGALPKARPEVRTKNMGTKPTQAKTDSSITSGILQKSEQVEAQALFQYFLDEVELDAQISRREQDEKIQEFKKLSTNLSPEIARALITLLLEETRIRIIDILQNACLEESEIKAYLADHDEAIQRVQNMDIETARQMLFFVAELKIHRQYVYEFGIALGAPAKQLLRHDLCKLSAEQFEPYVRYFRGGRLESDKAAFLAAWEIHQHEEHHLESYRKEKGYIDNFSDERLQNNMLETTADMLAATKQRGGGPLTDWLVNVCPKSNPHPRLIPFLRNGLKAAHECYLESTTHSDSDSIFKNLPSWNSEVEEMFRKLASSNPTDASSLERGTGESQISWLPDAGRADFSITSGI